MKRIPLLMLIAVLAAAGCSEGKAKLKGKIVENGQPKTFGATQAAVEITPIGPAGEPDTAKMFTAVVNEDGSFEVVASGGELPVGTYQIVFKGYGPLLKKYLAVQPIKRELKAGANEIVIDLAKPE